METKSESHRQSAIGNRQLSWHGWKLDLPARWNPVKLEGDADQGMILLADLHRPRLGVRWAKPAKKGDVGKAVREAMTAEVGQLAAAEAVDAAPPGDDWEHGQLYLDPDPPGRDVWVGYSRSTGRLFELVYHARHRDRGLVETVLAGFVDSVGGAWSIFDLSATLPPEAKLDRQLLNVGDLRLDFTLGRSPIVIRAVAVATLALTRQPLDRWLIKHQLGRRKHYRPTGQPQPIEWTINGQPMKGFRRELKRRRRWFFLRRLPQAILGVVLRDESRDKLLIVEGVDENQVRETIGSM